MGAGRSKWWRNYLVECGQWRVETFPALGRVDPLFGEGLTRGADILVFARPWTWSLR